MLEFHVCPVRNIVALLPWLVYLLTMLIGSVVGASCKGQPLCCDNENVGYIYYFANRYTNRNSSWLKSLTFALSQVEGPEMVVVVVVNCWVSAASKLKQAVLDYVPKVCFTTWILSESGEARSTGIGVVEGDHHWLIFMIMICIPRFYYCPGFYYY